MACNLHGTHASTSKRTPNVAHGRSEWIAGSGTGKVVGTVIGGEGADHALGPCPGKGGVTEVGGGDREVGPGRDPGPGGGIGTGTGGGVLKTTMMTVDVAAGEIQTLLLL